MLDLIYHIFFDSDFLGRAPLRRLIIFGWQYLGDLFIKLIILIEIYSFFGNLHEILLLRTVFWLLELRFLLNFILLIKCLKQILSPLRGQNRRNLLPRVSHFWLPNEFFELLAWKWAFAAELVFQDTINISLQFGGKALFIFHGMSGGDQSSTLSIATMIFVVLNTLRSYNWLLRREFRQQSYILCCQIIAGGGQVFVVNISIRLLDIHLF